MFRGWWSKIEVQNLVSRIQRTSHPVIQRGFRIMRSLKYLGMARQMAMKTPSLDSPNRCYDVGIFLSSAVAPTLQPAQMICPCFLNKPHFNTYTLRPSMDELHYVVSEHGLRT